MEYKRKILKWTGIGALTIVLLPFVLAAALYIPFVQNWAAHLAADIASEETGLDITIERLRIRFPLDIELNNFTAVEERDTVLHTDTVIVDLDLSRIFTCHVGVEAIDICRGVVNTRDLVAQLRLKGGLGKLHLEAEDIDLDKHHAVLSGALLDKCDLAISMRDTTIVDTTESKPILWSIDVNDVQILRSRVEFHSVRDSMVVDGVIRRAALSKGDVALEHGRYQVRKLNFETDSLLLTMKQENGDMSLKLPYTALLLKDFDLDGMKVKLGHMDLKTGGNIELSLPDGDNVTRCARVPVTTLLLDNLRADTTCVAFSHIDLQTHTDPDDRSNASSRIQGALEMDLNAFTSGQHGHVMADLMAMIQKKDLMNLAGEWMPDEVSRIYPDKPLNARILSDGNIDAMLIDTLRVWMSGVADIKAQGSVANMAVPDNLSAQLRMKADVGDVDFVRRGMGLTGFRIPSMTVTADAVVDGHNYRADALLQEGSGSAKVRASLNTDAMSYAADMDIRNLNVHDFLPDQEIYNVTATADVSGCGTDFLSPSTRMMARAYVQDIRYQKIGLSDINLQASLRNGKGMLDLGCDNEYLQASACADALVKGGIHDVDFSLDLSHIDLYKLNVVDKPFSASMGLNIIGNTNLKDSHSFDGQIQAIEIVTEDSIFHPMDLSLGLTMNPDTVFAYADAGDLKLKLNSHHGWETLMSKVNAFTGELQKEIKSFELDQATLKTLLPSLELHLYSARTNPLGNLLRSFGYDFQELALDVTTDPDNGLNGSGHMYKLNTGAVCLDTIQIEMRHPDDGILSLLRVKNGPRNKVVDFEATLRNRLTNNGLESALKFVDAKGVKGVDLGFKAETSDSMLMVHLEPLEPILAYRHFKVNADNYISLDRKNHAHADLHLIADDGTALKLYSTPNEEAAQDLTVSIYNFNLGELSNVLPFMPVVTGFLNGDAHFVKTDTETTVSLDMGVKNMTYEGTAMGDMGLDVAYFPNADGSHYVDGILKHNGCEVSFLNGKYWQEDKEGMIQADARLERLPLNIANAFIPNKLARLEGYAHGHLDVSGAVSAPLLSGMLLTDSMHICSDPYSIDLRFPDDSIVIDRSYLDLKRIEAYANGNNPMSLDGYIDFKNPDRIKLDLSVDAKDFNLINAKKNTRAQAYGKVYVDLNGRINGTLQNLNVNGRLHVNGKTDVTYVMKDAPLSVSDQLNELVTFCDFADTTEVEKEPVDEQNIRMKLQIDIDEATSVHCMLNESGADKIDIEGGGSLTLSYDKLNGLRAYGRYTIIEGRLDYSLVVASLKDFKIHNGSYVEFIGDIMNPHLNIHASERKKATVTQNNVPVSVNFDVGLNITQSLEDLGLEFTLEAPENMTVQNEISAMSNEERSRAAVTLLATGMYMSSTSQSASTGGFNTTNTLNSFLQGQISKIAGKALSTIDIGFGIDNTKSATGTSQTDYNFSFAKRFWGNRVSVIIGGKVSSGANAVNNGQSIINNVSVEYRLDKSGTRYVKAFYNKNPDNLLEPDIMEMGASLVLRRKTEKLGELFIFRTKKKKE